MKYKEVAKKMTKLIEISSIGVSKDSQIRATKILDVIANAYKHTGKFNKSTLFFHYVYNVMEKRWRQLSYTVSKGQTFSLPNLPTEKCNSSCYRFGKQPSNFSLLIEI